MLIFKIRTAINKWYGFFIFCNFAFEIYKSTFKS